MQTSFGERLKTALAHWDQGHQALARRLEKQGVRGGSYRSLANYLGNRSTPSLAWIRAAVEILRVDERWLTTGEGEMLPSDLDQIRVDPKDISCATALHRLKASESDITTITHLMLARDRFEDAYGHTEGVRGAEDLYAEHLLLPLRVLLLHVRGSDQLTGARTEIVRQALNQYLELVLLLLPVREAVSDEASRTVSRRLSVSRTKEIEESYTSAKAIVREHNLKLKPEAKEEV